MRKFRPEPDQTPDVIPKPPTDLLAPAIGWAVGSTVFAYAIHWVGRGLGETPLSVIVVTGLAFCLLPALPLFLSAARSPLPDPDEPDTIDRSIGNRWVVSLSLVTAAVGCLFAASQHAMNGYYVLTGILIFFATVLTGLFRQVDHYLSLPKMALVYGIQVAVVATILGP
jgi:hypothetical protein